MKRSTLAALLLLPSLAACGGGVGGSRPAVLPQSASAPLEPDSAIREAQSDSTQSAAAPFVASSSDLLYVSNVGTNSITIYPHDASGNAKPVKVIAGNKTRLDGPGQLSEDAAGNLYVLNAAFPRGTSSSVLVFAHGASGDVAPIREIAGTKTGLGSFSGSGNGLAMTVDQTTGKIFVMVDVDGHGRLLRFAPNANGNEAPFAASLAKLGDSAQLASDSTGKYLISPSENACCGNLAWGVATLSKQFSDGDLPGEPYDTSKFSYLLGVADDPTTKTYLVTGFADFGGGIFRFAEDTSGAAPHFTPPLVSTITSDTCGGQLALGYLRNIYVVQGVGCGTYAVNVYEHDASGNARPLRVLAGSATKLDVPVGIYEGK